MDDVTKYPTTGVEFRFQDVDKSTFVVTVEDGYGDKDGSGDQRLCLDRVSGADMEEGDMEIGPILTIAQARAFHTTLGEILYGPRPSGPIFDLDDLHESHARKIAGVFKEAAEEMAGLVNRIASASWHDGDVSGFIDKWSADAAEALQRWSACLK